LREVEKRYREGIMKPQQVGFMQDLFPNIPAWIRSGAIDTRANGFCICPNCNPFNN